MYDTWVRKMLKESDEVGNPDLDDNEEPKDRVPPKKSEPDEVSDSDGNEEPDEYEDLDKPDLEGIKLLQKSKWIPWSSKAEEMEDLDVIDALKLPTDEVSAIKDLKVLDIRDVFDSDSFFEVKLNEPIKTADSDSPDVFLVTDDDENMLMASIDGDKARYAIITNVEELKEAFESENEIKETPQDTEE